MGGDALRHGLQWFIHLLAHSRPKKAKGDEHPSTPPTLLMDYDTFSSELHLHSIDKDLYW